MSNVLKSLVAATALFVAGAVHAQGTVHIMVPFAPGGPVDAAARLMVPGLTKALGKTVVVENRGGAGGTLGAQYVAKSKPDGLTLLLATASFVMSAGTQPHLSYDPRKDLEPIALVGQDQTLLVVRPGLGVKTLADLVKRAKAGQHYSYGSAGTGSTMNIGGELLNMETGIKVTHVPYKGFTPALNDLLGGQVDMVNADVPALIPYLQSKQLVGLVIYDHARSPKLPDVPSADEVGYPGLNMGNWYGMFLPAGVPPDVKKRTEDALMEVIRSPDVAKSLAALGWTDPADAATFKKRLDADFDRWLPFIKKAGITTE
jgi:tripartite-type tricarboxylate transporter receptor subunit TctC